jgi:aspartate-semialdehyde dehydrogenase
LVFSGLDSSVAREIGKLIFLVSPPILTVLEGAFRSANFVVFSNSKNYRMDADVPLVVPYVNPEHLDVIKHQRKVLNLTRGAIVTNANCSTTGLVVALKPLHDAFGIEQFHVSTLQAISGAGYPGLSALDIMSNVIPYIEGEEGKIQTEPLKILGKVKPDGSGFVNESILIDATCHRVPVIDGHTETVSIRFKRKPESMDQVKKVLESFVSVPQQLKVHSAPKRVIVVNDEINRPQPRLDLMLEGGYAVTVGRLRKGHYWDLTFTVLSHNTVLGAAGSSILNAELAYTKALII